MKTIDIKGKNYVTVVERLKYFREHYSDWSLETEWIFIEEEKAACRVVIKNPDGQIKSTGTAMEMRDAKNSLVNKTSHVENCETSAVGRALGNLGIGLDGDVASKEEIELAQKQQLIFTINSMIDDKNREEYESEYKLSEMGMMSIEELEVIKSQLEINQKNSLCKAISKIATPEEMQGILKKYKTKNIGNLDLKDLIFTHDTLVKFNQKCSKAEIKDLLECCEIVDVNASEYIKEHYKKELDELTKKEYVTMKKKISN
ncbi:hypothetical protein [Fusobacterium necrophorum]|uniref:hypothetical protein n=1 Tax=Fusobacterium necrophorum TaxID=859 RepID=UPI002A7B3D0A|nr:hypothetical protein [Fusobacterium necrophorum]MDY2572710.1 hypothetical protein [Fusobacterium necrophorum]